MQNWYQLFVSIINTELNKNQRKNQNKIAPSLVYDFRNLRINHGETIFPCI